MSVKNLVIILFLFFSQNMFPQTRISGESQIFKELAETGSSQGKVAVHQDQQLEQMVLRYIEYRKKDNRIRGYRIRIYSDSGTSARQRGTSEQIRFSSLYPDIPSVLVYEQPNWKLYVGDFRTKGEAYKAYKLIRKDFSRAFLVYTKITPPKL